MKRTLNTAIKRSKSAKNDEFYTQYADIQKEINAYPSYTYDTFCNTIAQFGALADTFSFRFSTKYFDTETGLYYYGYRYYSPELMRWLNRDPIEEAGGENLYAFLFNSPTCKYDYLGLADTLLHLGDNFVTIESRIAKYTEKGSS